MKTLRRSGKAGYLTSTIRPFSLAISLALLNPFPANNALGQKPPPPLPALNNASGQEQHQVEKPKGGIKRVLDFLDRENKGPQLNVSLKRGIRDGDEPGRIKQLLEEGADPNAQDYESKVNVLEEAVWHNTIEVVKLLVEYGADIEAKNNGGKTALSIAKERGRSDIVEYLEQQIKREEQQASLFEAIESKDIGKVRRAIEDGANVNPRPTRESWTPLMAAADVGAIDIVKLLVGRGADINSMVIYAYNWDDCGSALHYAARKGNIDVVKFLVAKGANLDDLDVDMQTPLMRGVIGYDADDGKHILPAGHFNVVKFLVDRGADKDAQDDRGWTALMYASDNGDSKVVAYLLSKGANKDLKNKDDETALMIAERRKREKIEQENKKAIDSFGRPSDSQSKIYSLAIYPQNGKAEDGVVIRAGNILKDRRNTGALHITQIFDLYDWVAHDVKYLNVEEGGEPRRAGLTLAAGQGDCKNMAALLSAMSSVIGARSVIHTTTSETGGHAYNAVRVATAVDSARYEEIKKTITGIVRQRYGKKVNPTKILFFKDDEGLWLALDATYQGRGYPGLAQPDEADYTVKIGNPDHNMELH